MAAPQTISLGIGSPASIGWFLTFGLGSFAFEAPVPIQNRGNISFGLTAVSYGEADMTLDMPSIMFEPLDGLHDIASVTEEVR